MSVKHTDHTEVWQRIEAIVLLKPEIVTRLAEVSKDEEDGQWTMPLYRLMLLIQKHSSLTAAIRNSGGSERVIRRWLTSVHSQAYARAFVEWLSLEGYAIELINHMDVHAWPWLINYFTLNPLTNPDTIKPFVINPAVGTFLAQHIEYLEKEREVSRMRAHYAEMVMDGSLDIDVLRRAVRLIELEREASQQPVTERDRALQAAREVRIKDLDFSTRTHTCLRKADILTVADLADTPEGELMTIRNFGRKSLIEVREKLADHGLSPR